MKNFKKLLDAMRAMPVFKPEMRQANRDERKSQTRRVMVPQVGDVYWEKKMNHASIWSPEKELPRFCPYGKAGDLVYMREPLERTGKYAFYKDDNAPVTSLETGEWLEWRWKNDVLTSIFMPKEAARSFYRYEFVRVEQVQDISHEDAVAEGCYEQPEKTWGRLGYSQLFDKINAKRGCGWDVNPWVWVLGYKPVIYFTPGNVGDLNSIAAELRDIRDRLHKTGEYAKG